MTRIAAGVLTVGAVLAMTSVFPADASAAPSASSVRLEQTAPARPQLETRSSRVLALLVALEALSQAPATVPQH